MVSFNDANDFFDTMAEGGNAFRFEDIDGIGPKTANKITSVRGVRALDDVQDMSADELSDKAGISYSRAEKAIRGAGGNPNVSKRNDSSLSNTSAAGISQPQGDFLVDFAELDKARAKNDARSRSEAAVRADDRQRAPVTTDYEKWKGNKSRWDFPGVDTPKENPDLLPKDLKAGSPNTADFQARDEQMRERKEQSYPRKEKDGRVLQQKGNRLLAADVASEGPEGAIPGLAPNDFDPYSGESMVADGMGGPMPNSNLGRVVETDRPDEEQAPPQAALREQSQGTDDTNPLMNVSDTALDAGITITGFVKSQTEPLEYEGDYYQLGGTTQAPLSAAKATGDRTALRENTADTLATAVGYLEDEYDGNPDEELEGYSELRSALL